MHLKIHHFTSVCQIEVTSSKASKSRHPVQSHCSYSRNKLKPGAHNKGDLCTADEKSTSWTWIFFKKDTKCTDSLLLGNLLIFPKKVFSATCPLCHTLVYTLSEQWVSERTAAWCISPFPALIRSASVHLHRVVTPPVTQSWIPTKCPNRMSTGNVGFSHLLRSESGLSVSDFERRGLS